MDISKVTIVVNEGLPPASMVVSPDVYRLLASDPKLNVVLDRSKIAESGADPWTRMADEHVKGDQ